MSILDIIIAVVVLIGVWRGFMRGAMRTVISLMAWLAALIAANRLAGVVAPSFAGVVDSAVLQSALGFVTVFLLTIALLQLVVYFFAKALSALKLSFIDKLAGGVLGAALGVLKVLVVLSLTAPLLIRLPIWQSSPLAQNLMPFAPMAKQLVYQAVGKAWDEINRSSASDQKQTS